MVKLVQYLTKIVGFSSEDGVGSVSRREGRGLGWESLGDQTG